MRERNVRIEPWVLRELERKKGCFSLPLKRRDDWPAWKRGLLAAIRRLLGPTPPPVPLAPRTEFKLEHNGVIYRKITFPSHDGMYVPAWLLIPKGIRRGERRAGILYCHGHGAGKDKLVGFNARGEPVEEDYQHFGARRFAEAGYVVLAPDWHGFGERAERPEWVRQGRDRCNVIYLAAGYLGYHLLALNIFEGKRCLDLLCSLTQVDPRRIGCIGTSFGGTMTTYLTALDRRIRTGVIGCYLSTLGSAMGPKNGNFCGNQYMPGLATVGDIPEVAASWAPKPLLAEIGKKDTCFDFEDAISAYKKVKELYEMLGLEDRCDADIFDGPHEFSGRKAFDWFAKWLK